MSEKDDNVKNPEDQEGQPPVEVKTISEWIASAPDEDKELLTKLLEAEVAPLKNTVSTLRTEQKDLVKQLRDAKAVAEKGSELEKQLTAQIERAEEAEKKSAFFEEAPLKDCNNPKLAYILAKTENLYNAKGEPDWDAIKQSAPELFIKKGLDTDAGGGSGKNVTKKVTMNDWIRAKAGVKPE